MATGQYDYQILQTLQRIESYVSDTVSAIDDYQPFIIFGVILLGLYVCIRCFTVFRGK